MGIRNIHYLFPYPIEEEVEPPLDIATYPSDVTYPGSNLFPKDIDQDN